MIAGVPGVGVNGLLYVVLAGFAPLREAARALAGRGSRARAVVAGRSAAMGAAVVGALWVEYRVIEKVAQSLSPPAETAGSADVTKAIEAVGPKLAIAPFVVLGVVLLGMQVLRLALWTAAWASRRQLRSAAS
jgi:hypothetical protein